MKDILQKAAQVQLLIFDVDGVLTDGSLFLGDDGQEYKAFHSQDGHGIKMLGRAGIVQQREPQLDALRISLEKRVVLQR